MAVTTKTELRRYPRYRVEGNVPGRWIWGNSEIEVFLVDASYNGVGILVDRQLGPGDKLKLQLPELSQDTDTIEFVVRWCIADSASMSVPGLEGLNQCGLEVRASNFSVVDFFASLDSVIVEQ